MTGIDWTAVEGDSGHDVFFTVYDCNGVGEDISGHVITLKVWEDDGDSLKFSGACVLVGGGTAGRCKYTVAVKDFVFGDEGIYLFALKVAAGADIRNTLKGSLHVTQGPPA